MFSVKSRNYSRLLPNHSFKSISICELRKIHSHCAVVVPAHVILSSKNSLKNMNTYVFYLHHQFLQESKQYGWGFYDTYQRQQHKAVSGVARMCMHLNSDPVEAALFGGKKKFHFDIRKDVHRIFSGHS